MAPCAFSAQKVSSVLINTDRGKILIESLITTGKIKAEERPVAVLVQIASQYDSKIYLEADSKRVNAKSIMGMMTLGLVTGESITVEADGTDEEQAVAEIEKYLQNQ